MCTGAYIQCVVLILFVQVHSRPAVLYSGITGDSGSMPGSDLRSGWVQQTSFTIRENLTV